MAARALGSDLNRLDEVADRVGLANEAVRFRKNPIDDLRRGVAAAKHDRDAGILRTHSGEYFDSIEPGHREVEQDDVDRSVGTPKDVESLLATRRGGYGATVHFQDSLGDRTDRRLVVDD